MSTGSSLLLWEGCHSSMRTTVSGREEANCLINSTENEHVLQMLETTHKIIEVYQNVRGFTALLRKVA